VRAIGVVAIVVGIASTWAPAVAQNAAAPPTVNFRERPRYPSDPQRLRRTPQIDGVIGDNEWDPFYTVTDGPIKGTFYCNWDENYLYLAARTEQPATVIFDVDATGDGWLRGSDNMEIVVGNVTESGTPAVVARLLDASSSKDTPVWKDHAIDPKSFLIAGRLNGGAQVIELGIPKNIGGLVLRPGVNMGLRAEFISPVAPADYQPTQPFDPHLLMDATLAEARAVAAAGINPKLSLSDEKCVAGQKLFASLWLLNQTDAEVPIQSVSWFGQGNSANVVNGLKEVAVLPIPPLKTLKLKYRTDLPADLANGTYGLQVLVTLKNGRQLSAASTFTVVDPIQAQVSSRPEPVVIIGPTRVDLTVDVLSEVPDGFKGTVALVSKPDAWEVQGALSKTLEIVHKGHSGASTFRLRLPSNTPPGDYHLETTVTWHKRTWRLPCTIQVQQRADSAPPAQPAPAPAAPATH
jgi:hypothetical protein